MVVFQELVELIVQSRQVLLGVLQVTKAFLAKDSVEALDEGLLVLPVWLGGSDSLHVLLCERLPLGFELRPAVPLNAVHSTEVPELLDEGLLPRLRVQPCLQHHMSLSREGVDRRERIDVPEVDRVHLDDFTWLGALDDEASRLVLPPRSTKHVLLAQDAVDRRNGRALAVLLLEEVPNLLAAA